MKNPLFSIWHFKFFLRMYLKLSNSSSWLAILSILFKIKIEFFCLFGSLLKYWLIILFIIDNESSLSCFSASKIKRENPTL